MSDSSDPPGSPDPAVSAAPEGRRSSGIDTEAYAELRKIAARELGRERRDHTLRPTDLVHEAWLRMTPASARTSGPELFAARTMRRVLVDHARRRLATKRGAGKSEPLEGDFELPTERDACVVDLDRALSDLSELAPDVAQVVELRFFAGASVEETAAALGVSPRTVKRRWQLAKGWLHREIAGDDDE